MSCSRANVQTSLSVQSASGLTFNSFLPEGNGNVSRACRFARVGDCTRRKPGEPDLVVLRAPRTAARLCAACSIDPAGLIQDAEFRFLLGYGPLGHDVHQIESVSRGHLIAVAIDLGKVIAGFEEQHGYVRQTFADEMQHHHVFRLEAAGEAELSPLALKRLGDEYSSAVTLAIMV